MGEFVLYQGTRIKIGTAEELIYVNFPQYINALQQGQLAPSGRRSPSDYARPNAGYIFRFPFPDEDIMPLGSLGHFVEDRAITLRTEFNEHLAASLGIPPDHHICQQRAAHFIAISGQKLLQLPGQQKQMLSTVVRDIRTGRHYQLTDPKAVAHLLNTISMEYLQTGTPSQNRNFWSILAIRMAAGYLSINSHQDIGKIISDTTMFTHHPRTMRDQPPTETGKKQKP